MCFPLALAVGNFEIKNKNLLQLFQCLVMGRFPVVKEIYKISKMQLPRIKSYEILNFGENCGNLVDKEKFL